MLVLLVEITYGIVAEVVDDATELCRLAGGYRHAWNGFGKVGIFLLQHDGMVRVWLLCVGQGEFVRGMPSLVEGLWTTSVSFNAA